MSADCIGTGCKAESLLKRIAELEAERDELLGPNPVEAMLRNELAALRQKIEDAPVVAWKLLDGDGGVSWADHPITEPGMQWANANAETRIPLIRKEDLK